MYTNKPIQLHTKCLCLLQMIQEASNRAERAKANLLAYYVAKEFDLIKLVNKREHMEAEPERWLRVVERLVGYYERTFKLLEHVQ